MIHSLRPRLLVHCALIATLLGLVAWVSPSATASSPLIPGIGQEQAEQGHPKEQTHRKPAKKLVKKARAIVGEYIVVLDDDVIGAPGEHSPAESLADSLVSTYGGKVRRRFKHAINAFTATMTEGEAQTMSEDALVAYIEEDSEVTLSAVQSPATWGLDRVDQRLRTLNNSYSYTYMGAGVNVFVVDTGIRTNHVDFGGRAFAGAAWDFVGDGRNGQDCHGHGTHVAGTIGGNTVGVAKRAALYSVRVFDCLGKTGTGRILAAVNTITAYHRKPAVVNMSLGGPIDYALDTAVTNSVNAGITYVVAAGNDGVDACTVSPARAPGTITVGATDALDRRAVFTPTGSSNYGACVDVWAPGLNITSAAHTSTNGLTLKSGTSMASPHVAGAAAIYLSAYPSATPAAVRSIIQSTATTGGLTGIGSSSPNRLLFSLLR